jgi:hypothetical protein
VPLGRGGWAGALAVALVASSGPAHAYKVEVMRVDAAGGDSVSVRARPSFDAPVVGKLEDGVKVVVLERALAVDGEPTPWFGVVAPAPPPWWTLGDDQHAWRSSREGIALRARPSLAAPVVWTIPAGEPLFLQKSTQTEQIDGNGLTWYRAGPIEGWIYDSRAGDPDERELPLASALPTLLRVSEFPKVRWTRELDLDGDGGKDVVAELDDPEAGSDCSSEADLVGLVHGRPVVFPHNGRRLGQGIPEQEIAGVADVTGDGRPELLVKAHYAVCEYSLWTLRIYAVRAGVPRLLDEVPIHEEALATSRATCLLRTTFAPWPGRDKGLLLTKEIAAPRGKACDGDPGQQKGQVTRQRYRWRDDKLVLVPAGKAALPTP